MLYCFSSLYSLFIHFYFNLSWELTITTFILWSDLWLCWAWIKMIALTFIKSWELSGRGLMWMLIYLCVHMHVCVCMCMFVCVCMCTSKYWLLLFCIYFFVHCSAQVVWSTGTDFLILLPQLKVTSFICLFIL